MFKWLAAAAALAVALPLAWCCFVTTSLAASQASATLAGGPSVAGAGPHPAGLPGAVHGRGANLPRPAVGRAGRDRQGRKRPRPVQAPGVHSGANYAGAEGPMQFEPATFAQYAVDGDQTAAAERLRPGRRDLHRRRDALRRRRRGRDTEAGIRQAVFAYNHSQAYVADVLAWAARYTSPAPPAAPRPGDRVRSPPGRQALPVLWGSRRQGHT